MEKGGLERLYLGERKSVREIAKELKLSKNTIDYYLIKFKIPKRSQHEAILLSVSKHPVWCEGLSKETDLRLKKANEKRLATYQNKREVRIKEIEKIFNLKLEEILYKLYWDNRLTQEKIAKKIKLDRTMIIKLMKKYQIKLRPNYAYIASLKGKNHPMYGRTWEQTYGKEGAKRIRQETSERFRKLILKRLQNKEMPFSNTKIELIVQEALEEKGIDFISQFIIDNKFVCDFAILSKKLIIECDGDYWHANPKIYKDNLDKRQLNNLKRDRFKDEYLKRKGWKVLRFFESEIYSNIKECIKKIIIAK